MTGKVLWQKLKTLVDCDKQLMEMEQVVVDSDNSIKKDFSLIQKLRDSNEGKNRKCIEEKKNVHMQELHAKRLKEQEEYKRSEMLKITNQKEYKALEKETRLVVNQQTKQDDVLVRAWDCFELANKDLEKTMIESNTKISQLENDIKNKEELIETTHGKLKKHQEDRQKAACDIPKDWLMRYERMKHNVPDPIVSISQSSCGACYYSILQQDLYKLKKSGVLLCRNCYRFLYYDEEEEKDAKNATF
jgi:uncharacterized protein